MVVRRLRRENERGQDASDAEGDAHRGALPAGVPIGTTDEVGPHRALEGQGAAVGHRQRRQLGIGNRGVVVEEQVGIEARVGELDAVARGRAGRPASAWPRSACAARTDGHRPGRRAARRGLIPASSPSLRPSSASSAWPAASSRGEGNDDHSAGGGARLATSGSYRLVLPVGRRVAAEVEEPFEGIEDGVAATATHPALGHLELVLDDSKRRPARGAARRQTHRQIMPCGERRIACRRGGSSRRLRRRRRDRATARRRCAARRPGARARRRGPAGRRRRPAPTAPARAA